MQFSFVTIGAAVGVAAGLGYLFDTVRGNAQLSRVSFFLWTVTPTVTFCAQLSEGVGWIAFQTLSMAILSALILLASLRVKGAQWQVSKFDLLCGVFSLLGVVLWLVTRSGDVAIIFSIIADACAALPTILKAYHHPESEVTWPWFLTGLGAAIGMLAVTDWTFTNYGFLLYLLVCNIIICSFVRFRPRRSNLERHVEELLA